MNSPPPSKRESQPPSLLALASQAAGVGAWRWDLHTNQVEWDDGCLTLFGLPLGQAVDFSTFANAVHQEDYPRLHAMLDLLRHGKAPFELEYRVCWPDRSVHWLTSRGSVLLDSTGAPRAISGLLIDSSERKQNELSLSESNARFRSMLEHSLDIVYRRDLRKDAYDYLSPVVEQVLGFRAETFMRMPMAELIERIHPDDRASIDAGLLSPSEAGQVRLEYRLLHADGNYRWLADYASIHRDAFGQPIYLSGILRDITRQKQAEEALAASEERLRMLAQATFEGITIGENGIILEANEQFARMHGYTLEEVIGQPVTAFVIPEDRARVTKSIHSGEERIAEFHALRKDGSTFFLEAHGYSVRREGRMLRITALRDINASKLAEQALRQREAELRESEEHFRLAARALNEGLWDWDFRSGKQWWNETYDRLYGPRPPHTNTDASWWEEHLHPDDRQRVLPGFFAAVQGTADRWQEEYRFRRRDGGYAYVIDRAAFLRDPQGKIIRATGAMIDLTTQKETEAELRASEERFRVALTAIELSVFTTDRNLRYTWIYNPRFGLSTADFIGKRDDELQPPENVAALVDFKQAVIESGQPARTEISFFVGEELATFIVTLEPLYDARAAISGLLGAALDITQLRRLEEENIEQATRMEVQRRLLDHREQERLGIARDIHDGPIQDLVGAIFNLQLADDTVSDPQAQQVFDQIGDSLKDIVRDLREVCNQLRPPALNHFGLPGAIQVHAADFAERHPNLQLQIDTQGELTQLTEAASLALFRIYQESLTNIVRHAIARHAWVTLTANSEQITLLVRDDGQGFPVETGDPMGQTEQGHFGLVGMFERAQVIGATITIQSTPGQGTTVRVSAPIQGNLK